MDVECVVQVDGRRVRSRAHSFIPASLARRRADGRHLFADSPRRRRPLRTTRRTQSTFTFPPTFTLDLTVSLFALTFTLIALTYTL